MVSAIAVSVAVPVGAGFAMSNVGKSFTAATLVVKPTVLVDAAELALVSSVMRVVSPLVKLVCVLSSSLTDSSPGVPFQSGAGAKRSLVVVDNTRPAVSLTAPMACQLAPLSVLSVLSVLYCQVP